jgi:hypothetical protein
MRNILPFTGIIQNNLILWYKMNEFGNVLLDRSGNGNNGNIIGATRVNTLGSSALNFNGSSNYVKILDSSSLSPTDQVSVSTWVSFDQKRNNQGIIWKNNLNYILFSDSDETKFNVFDSNGDSSLASFSNNLITIGSKYNIIGVYGSDHISRLYLNGYQVGTIGTARTGIRDTVGDLYIGARGDFIQYFDGIIGETRIYNIGLSPSESYKIYMDGAF